MCTHPPLSRNALNNQVKLIYCKTSLSIYENWSIVTVLSSSPLTFCAQDSLLKCHFTSFFKRILIKIKIKENKEDTDLRDLRGTCSEETNICFSVWSLIRAITFGFGYLAFKSTVSNFTITRSTVLNKSFIITFRLQSFFLYVESKIKSLRHLYVPYTYISPIGGHSC